MYPRQVTLDVKRPMTVPVNSLRVLQALEEMGATERVELPAQKIADHMGCARATCVSRIHQAEAQGLIRVRERVGGSGVQLSHEYRILELGNSVLEAARREKVIEKSKDNAE